LLCLSRFFSYSVIPSEVEEFLFAFCLLALHSFSFRPHPLYTCGHFCAKTGCARGAKMVFVVGIEKRVADFEVSNNFLEAISNNPQYGEAIDSYAAAVAGRTVCGSPEHFYCRSGIAIRIEVHWPVVLGTDFK
jgi:hypothetical protein